MKVGDQDKVRAQVVDERAPGWPFAALGSSGLASVSCVDPEMAVPGRACKLTFLATTAAGSPADVTRGLNTSAWGLVTYT